MSEPLHGVVISQRESREVLGHSAGRRPIICLNPAYVPREFHCWIALAEKWGISDDSIREDCVRAASAAELKELLAFGECYNGALESWLAGPEASTTPPSAEYVAFSALGMAWDSAMQRFPSGAAP
jgi:hypothetical protein